MAVACWANAQLQNSSSKYNERFWLQQHHVTGLPGRNALECMGSIRFSLVRLRAWTHSSLCMHANKSLSNTTPHNRCQVKCSLSDKGWTASFFIVLCN